MADVIPRGFPDGTLYRGAKVAQQFDREGNGGIGLYNARFYGEDKPGWRAEMVAYRTKSGTIVVRWLL